MTATTRARPSATSDQPVPANSRDPVRVLVVDDHQMFAEALAAALQTDSDVAVVDTVGSATNAIRRLARDSVDVVLLDLRLPDTTGMSGLDEVLAAAAGAAVVLVTAVEDDATLLEAVERGCVGVIRKTAGLDDVLAAVHRAAAGEALVSPALLAQLLDRVARRAAASGPSLTPREAQVLAGIVSGHTNAEIGRDLFLSVNTVRNHVQSLLGKLGAHSKLEAAAIAVRDRIVTPAA